MPTLRAHIERLLAWLGERAHDSAVEVRVVELTGAEIGAAPLTLHPSRLRRIEDCEARFAQLLNAGYSWLNLSCYGFGGGFLIVAIELPLTAPGLPAGATSVNFSGPPARQSEAAWLIIG